MSAKSRTSRRGLLIGLGGLVAIAWGWQRFGVNRGMAKRTEIDGLPGWSKIETGAVTALGGSATGAEAVPLQPGQGGARGRGTDAAPDPAAQASRLPLPKAVIARCNPRNESGSQAATEM